MKVCSKCKIEKDNICFSFQKAGKNGLRSNCKDCDKKYHEENKTIDQKNRDKIRKDKKEAFIKICNVCNIEKNKSEFEFLKEKNNYRSQCKVCVSIRRQKHYKKNKNTLKEKRKKYYYLNLEKEKIYFKKYYTKNKEIIKIKNKEYNQKNKETIKIKNKKYKENHKNNIKHYLVKNKDSIKKVRNAREKLRKEIDPSYKLKTIMSKSINKMLKSFGFSKNGESFSRYLDCPINQLKKHIELLFSAPENLDHNGKIWMKWESWGIYNSKIWDDNDSSTWTWNVDHIIPQSDLPYTSMEDENFKKCWSLENLRPYSAKQNVLDGVNRVRHKKAA